MNMSHSLIANTGGMGSSGGWRSNMNLGFYPSPYGGSSYGMGAVAMNARQPSGRKVGTGYQKIPLKFTNTYTGEYYLTDQWGGMPMIDFEPYFVINGGFFSRKPPPAPHKSF